MHSSQNKANTYFPHGEPNNSIEETEQKNYLQNLQLHHKSIRKILKTLKNNNTPKQRT